MAEELLFYFLISAVTGSVVGLFLYLTLKNDSSEELRDANKAVGELQSQLAAAKNSGAQVESKLRLLEQDFAKLRNQKISADVKLGQKTEVIIPLIPEFPFSLDCMRFLGAPVDYVAFDLANDRIVFVEVKSGKSRLSAKQLHIKKLIQEKKVEFIELRVGDNGIEFK